MAGWFFRDAMLEDDEQLIFRRGANLRRGRRSVGGEVSVTDQRLIFVPNRLEQLVGGRVQAVPRAEVADVTVVKPPANAERFKGLPGAVRARAEVDTADGVWILALDDAAALARVLEPGIPGPAGSKQF